MVQLIKLKGSMADLVKWMKALMPNRLSEDTDWPKKINTVSINHRKKQFMKTTSVEGKRLMEDWENTKYALPSITGP